MKFSELDDKMRVFETSHDVKVLPGIHIVVRLDGKGFTRLAEDLNLIRPFDIHFNAHMREITANVMQTSGIRIIYGYTQSDEISLLLHKEVDTFGRKERKLNSVLAGELSAHLSLKLQRKAVFDSRVCQLPTDQNVIDYFRWRQEDASRNCLSTVCHWTLIKSGLSARKASKELYGLNRSQKQELLFSLGVNFNNLETWQKRGVGFQWTEEISEGFNPVTKEVTPVTRRSLQMLDELPYGDAYNDFIQGTIVNTK